LQAREQWGTCPHRAERGNSPSGIQSMLGLCWKQIVTREPELTVHNLRVQPHHVPKFVACLHSSSITDHTVHHTVCHLSHSQAAQGRIESFFKPAPGAAAKPKPPAGVAAGAKKAEAAGEAGSRYHRGQGLHMVNCMCNSTGARSCSPLFGFRRPCAELAWSQCMVSLPHQHATSWPTVPSCFCACLNGLPCR
jgi:hypothetical protein